uniref:Uncharacterized protein n=1 Tax=Micrurus lemniscatus lemniscatus TaxID=129467 RepID=A0A2D4IN94_MICLE
MVPRGPLLHTCQRYLCLELLDCLTPFANLDHVSAVGAKEALPQLVGLPFSHPSSENLKHRPEASSRAFEGNLLSLVELFSSKEVCEEGWVEGTCPWLTLGPSSLRGFHPLLPQEL